MKKDKARPQAATVTMTFLCGLQVTVHVWSARCPDLSPLMALKIEHELFFCYNNGFMLPET